MGPYFLNRGMWSTTVMPGDAELSTGLEFCRREIERRHCLLRRVLLWSFGPVLLATGAFVLALAMIGTKRPGTIPEWASLPGYGRRLDIRILRHESAGTA